MKSSAHLAVVAVTLSVASLCRCAKQEEAQRKPTALVQPSASVVPAASVEALDSAAPPIAIGAWAEVSLYKFSVSGLRRCPMDGANAGDGAMLRFGVTVTIVARVDNVMASPRDVSLERAGVILQSELDGKGCGSPLVPRQLRTGETASGVVIFDAPDEDFARGAVIAFKPTRWGGAPRVLVGVPDCLDACEGSIRPPRAAARGAVKTRD